MKQYLDANTTPGGTDSETIQNAIAKAKAEGHGRVVIPRRNERTGKDEWIIDETVKLPSGVELLIDDAHLTLADGVYANMFANETARTEDCRRLSARQHGITIRGRGRAVLDGGNYNGLSERNSGKDGLPHISYNTTVLFVNVSGVLIENISVVRQRWWGITNVFVTDSVFRNIRFQSDFSRVDEDGVHHPDETPRGYDEIYIKNSDGIDLRVGCHNILIENISGFTEDDSVALTALGGFESKQSLMLAEPNADCDIHAVTLRNVSTSTYCANVRLLNDNGYKLYNVTVDGVTSLRFDPEYRNCHCVRIGDVHYAQTPSALGDTHHVTVRNVVSSAQYGVFLCKGLCDSVIENVTVTGGGEYAVAASRNPAGLAEVQNVRVRNLLTENGTAAADTEMLKGRFICEEIER